MGASKGEIRLAFLKPGEIRTLKKRHLNVDHATDVLSFPDETGGDIAVCLREVFRDARADGRERGEYLAEVILHGFLHLRGLEHDYRPAVLEKIWKKQKAILEGSKANPRAFQPLRP